MKPEVKRVKNYWMMQFSCLRIDTDVLSDCVASLTVEEHTRLRLWDGISVPDDSLRFVLSKVFNRHNDVCGGATDIVNDNGVYVVMITPKSSISELDISWGTLHDCNRQCIYHIEDASKEILPALSLEAIADLTRAILVADSDDAENVQQGKCVVVHDECHCETKCDHCSCLAKE